MANQKTRQQRRATERERGERLTSKSQQPKQRNPMLLAIGGIVGLLVVIAALVGAKLLQSSPTPAKKTGLAPASVVHDVSTVPASTFDTIGAVKGIGGMSRIGGTPLKEGGKPVVLYIGAEYCPYCAAMRWSMAVALSRFGTLTPLHGIHSSSTDVNPNTATLTFYKSGYHSKYLSFTPVETTTVSKAPLQNPTNAQNAVWAKYEPDPQTRGYPFIAFSNKQVMKGPIYDAAVLQGKSWSQIAATLTDTTSPVSQSVLGAANYITGAICQMTNNQPANVCNSAAVTAVKSGL